MTVSVQETRFPHVGNGLTVDFSFGCLIPTADDIVVTVDGTQITSGFTVSGLGSNSGGTVTFSVAPASGAVVVIERVIKLKRSTDYQQTGDFLSKVVNPDFDRLWMAMQQMETVLGSQPGAISRVLKLGPTDESGAGAYRAQNNRIQDLASPVNPGDASNRAFVESTLLNAISFGIGSAPVVDSIVGIKALSKSKITRVLVTGYYAAGDGGGGIYYYDSTDTTSADNGGTIVVATDGGRWKLAQSDVVSVKQFGAKGNGVTDDGTAIQAALNASLRVHFPAGTYIVSSTLTLRANHHLTGAATQASTLQANTDITVLSATDKQRVTIDDMEIFGVGKATSTKYGIQVINGAWWNLNRVYIIGFAKGVYFKAGGSYPASNFCNTIRESTIHYNTINIDCESDTNALTVIASTWGAANIGIRVINGNSLSIHGGDCEGCTTAGIYIDSPISALDFGLTVSGVHFEGNTSTSGDIVFGVTNRMQGASITGNLFYGAAGNATPLSVAYGSGVIFAGNTVGGTYVSAEPVLGTTSNIVVSGNYPASIRNLNTGGYAFPATQVPIADPNTLDDYEEGSWTPTWTGLTVVGTPTYSGRYVKIGKLVTCYLYVTSTTSTASTAGSTRISGGFPVPMSNQPGNIGGVTAANAGTIASYGVGVVNQAAGEVYTPTWPAVAAVALSFSYFSAD